MSANKAQKTALIQKSRLFFSFDNMKALQNQANNSTD